jgi:hypothetical protein
LTRCCGAGIVHTNPFDPSSFINISVSFIYGTLSSVCSLITFDTTNTLTKSWWFFPFGTTNGDLDINTSYWGKARRSSYIENSVECVPARAVRRNKALNMAVLDDRCMPHMYAMTYTAALRSRCFAESTEDMPKTLCCYW